MQIASSLFVVVGLIVVVWFYQRQLADTDLAEYSDRWLLGWVIKGLLVPVVVWILINAGTTPLMPGIVHVNLTRGMSPFAREWLYLSAQTSPALGVIGTYWAVVTMAGLAVSAFKRTAERDSGVFVSVALGIFVFPIIGVMIHRFGWGYAGMGLLMWLWPLTHYALTLQPIRDPVPRYSTAVAKMKRGKYAEAELAIVGELEKCATDFDGWMMLAELYAEQFHDLDEAEQTVLQLCDDPATTMPQVSIALHRLADWQLKLRHDPVSARRVLEAIWQRMPGTHLAKMARLRAGQLPASRAELDESHRIKPVQLHSHNEEFAKPAVSSAPTGGESNALARANQCVEQLNVDPANVPAREKLAEIFAEQLGQLNLAIEQVELLLTIPDQPVEKITEWLTTLAAWHTKRGDTKTAGEVLARLIHEYPQSPRAFPAQRRLSLLQMEARAARHSARGATRAAAT